MPDTTERFLEVDEIVKALLLMFQVLLHQQSSGEYLIIVLLYDLKPASSSSKISSAWFTSLNRSLKRNKQVSDHRKVSDDAAKFSWGFYRCKFPYGS